MGFTRALQAAVAALKRNFTNNLRLTHGPRRRASRMFRLLTRDEATPPHKRALLRPFLWTLRVRTLPGDVASNGVEAAVFAALIAISDTIICIYLDRHSNGATWQASSK